MARLGGDCERSPGIGSLMNGGMSLEGKKAIVTGAGRGIGRAIALELARSGADVALASRNVDDLESVADEISRIGRQALVVQTDVSISSQVHRMVATAIAKFGQVDVMVNNSGINLRLPLVPLPDPVPDWVRVSPDSGFTCHGRRMEGSSRHQSQRSDVRLSRRRSPHA